MSGEEPIENVLRRFTKKGIQGVMAGEPAWDQQPMPSETAKGKKSMASCPHMRKSP